MSVPIYGIQSAGPDTLPECPPATLTAAVMSSYVTRTNTVLASLLVSRQREQSIALLEVMRQEICFLLNKEFTPLPPPPDSGTQYQDNGKITLSNNRQ